MRIQTLTEETKKNLLEDLLRRSPNQYTEYEERVADILYKVRKERDKAVFEYTKMFDKADIHEGNIKVREEEIAEAYSMVDSSLVEIIRKALKILN